MEKIVKYIRSNYGFILAVIIIASIALSPKLKSLVLRGLIRTGFYEPDVKDLKPKAVTVSGKDTSYKVPSVLFTSSNQETIDLADLKGKVVFLNFFGLPGARRALQRCHPLIPCSSK